jgi:hypothetical protein
MNPMNEKNKNSGIASDLMQCREITLNDGRYMIFYTFDKSLSNSSAKGDIKPEPRPEPEAAEEKNV